MELEESDIGGLAVVCDICHQESKDYNRHMRIEHPGCGGMAINYMYCIFVYKYLF